MQSKPSRRSNAQRTEATRQALLAAARDCFIEAGYADASTPAIVAAAGITRGALYHHFADKRDLFRAVIEEEARRVALAIEAATPTELKPREALIAGSLAYLEAMAVPGRTRLLLREGPVVLGSAAMTHLDEGHAARTLREGLAAVWPNRNASPPLTELAALLSAAFDRAALEIEAGGAPDAYRNAILHLIGRLIDAD